ncbi:MULTISPECIES: helix-turn-helix domain-containing protein [Paracoccus]|nr:helix-turn-helix domain-containing protein [Falsiroseomonas sp.]MDP3417257.1 helix-turn-helix domain-containing protein [Falsiroseomonas sp.]
MRRLHEEERLSPTAIARRLGIARSSVYRFLPRVEQVDDL